MAGIYFAMNDEIERRLDAARKATMLLAADLVDNLAKGLVGNTTFGGGRDPQIYEQGIGCERAAKMLREWVKTGLPVDDLPEMMTVQSSFLVQMYELLDSGWRPVIEFNHDRLKMLNSAYELRGKVISEVLENLRPLVARHLL